MKLIVAIVRPEKLSDVLEALFHADIRGLTISRVQGHGGEIEHVENYRGTSVKMALLPPMPRASVRMVIAVLAGRRAASRTAYARSLKKIAMVRRIQQWPCHSRTQE